MSTYLYAYRQSARALVFATLSAMLS
jgi:hypothetical protein